MDHSKCSVSRGIHEGLTFGQGELDHNGYWSIPCGDCARRAEWRAGEKEGTFWPFPPNEGKKRPMLISAATRALKAKYEDDLGRLLYSWSDALLELSDACPKLTDEELYQHPISRAYAYQAAILTGAVHGAPPHDFCKRANEADFYCWDLVYGGKNEAPRRN